MCSNPSPVKSLKCKKNCSLTENIEIMCPSGATDVPVSYHYTNITKRVGLIHLPSSKCNSFSLLYN